MYKLTIKYKSGAKTDISNARKDIGPPFFNKYLKEHAQPVSNVESAILYKYPLKHNEPIVIIEDGQVVNEL